MRRLALAACPAAVARKALRPGENRRRPGSILEVGPNLSFTIGRSTIFELFAAATTAIPKNDNT